jgi:hypothetical protein
MHTYELLNYEGGGHDLKFVCKNGKVLHIPLDPENLDYQVYKERVRKAECNDLNVGHLERQRRNA